LATAPKRQLIAVTMHPRLSQRDHTEAQPLADDFR
jgi:hypothetical protein